MNTSPRKPMSSLPKAETQFYGGIKLNSGQPAIVQKPGDEPHIPTSELPIPQTKPARGNKFSSSAQGAPVSPGKNPKQILVIPRNLLNAAFAAATFIGVAISIMMLIFTFLPRGASAASVSAVGAAGNATGTLTDLVPLVSSETSSPEAIKLNLNAAGQAAGLSLATPTSTSTTSPAAAPLQMYEPPVVGQGGTCINGSVIDIYHNLVPADLNISVTPKGGGAAKTTKVDSTGHFSIPSLPAGTYTVSVEVRTGWKTITPAVFDVVLNGTNPDCAVVRAKFELPGCVIVSKYNCNCSGIKTGCTLTLPKS